jgi:hypothetical protein
MLQTSEDVLFKYAAEYNPKSNDDLKRFLRLYPTYRELIIDFTATWRAMSILDRMLPTPKPDPIIEHKLLQRAKANLRTLRRRRLRNRSA